MSRNKKIIIYSILSVSVLFNIITFSLDTYPYLYPKVKNKFFKEKTIELIDDNTEAKIMNRSLEMVKSPNVTMVWDEPKGVTQSLLSMRGTRSSSEFKKYNFPRAFLLYGISQYYIQKGDKNKLRKFKGVFDDYLDEMGNPTFTINRIDQATFGLTALNLYEEFKEEKYLSFSKKLYDYIIQSIEDDGIISYRTGQEIVYEDMLGMTVPFLLEYYKVKGNAEALVIAENQIKYYINFGVDKETFLPTHAINRKEKIKIGPTNWGRGIGWYFIALAYYHKETGEYKTEYEGIIKTLKKLRNSEDLWSQFPGGGGIFDASATTLFIYSMLLNEPTLYSKEAVLQLLKPYLSEKGEILQSSGDTYGLNRYSNTFGKSELSQGMLLLILSLYQS